MWVERRTTARAGLESSNLSPGFANKTFIKIKDPLRVYSTSLWRVTLMINVSIKQSGLIRLRPSRGLVSASQMSCFLKKNSAEGDSFPLTDSAKATYLCFCVWLVAVVLDVHTWAGKDEVLCRDVTLVKWKTCTCSCAAYGNVPKALCSLHGFYSAWGWAQVRLRQ